MDAEKKIEDAVLYCRVSDPSQAEKDLSIPAQKHSLREWAEANGFIIKKEFVEPGNSARDDNRPEFRRMIGELLDGTIGATVILVVHSSRFMRNTEASFVYRRKLEKKGVRVVSISQQIDDNPSGRLMETIFAAFDQYESDMNAYRTMAAMRQNAREGFFNGSRGPFGFKVVKVPVGRTERGRLMKNDEEAPILQQLLGLYVDGMGAKGIAVEMNRRGVLYRGRAWSKDDALRVLDEEAPTGTYYWGKWDTSEGKLRDRSEWIPIEVEGFVDRDLFDRVQALRHEREPKVTPGKTVSSPLLLAGLLRCGLCGGRFGKESSGKKFAGTHPHAYYNCSAFLRLRKGTCAGKRTRVQVLDRIVLDHIADQLFTTERCRELASAVLNAAGDVRRKTDDRRVQLRNQIDQLDRSIARWHAVFESGTQDLDVVAPRLRELRQERESLAAIVSGLKPLAEPPKHVLSERTIERFQAKVRDVFISADTSMTKTYLRFLVDRIVVHEDRIEIVGKDTNAVAMMADLDDGDVNHPEAVLAKGGEWLRIRRRLLTRSRGSRRDGFAPLALSRKCERLRIQVVGRCDPGHSHGFAPSRRGWRSSPTSSNPGCASRPLWTRVSPHRDHGNRPS